MCTRFTLTNLDQTIYRASSFSFSIAFVLIRYRAVVTRCLTPRFVNDDRYRDWSLFVSMFLEELIQFSIPSADSVLIIPRNAITARSSLLSIFIINVAIDKQRKNLVRHNWIHLDQSHIPVLFVSVFIFFSFFLSSTRRIASGKWVKSMFERKTI